MAAPRLLLLRALALGGLVLLVGWGGSGAEGQKKKEVSGAAAADERVEGNPEVIQPRHLSNRTVPGERGPLSMRKEPEPRPAG